MRSTDRRRDAEEHGDRPGWALERCDDGFITEKCKALKLEAAMKTARGAKGEAKRREALARSLGDEALIAMVLRPLSAFEIVLLESLVDLGGVAGVDELWTEACRRTSMERPFDIHEVERAINLLGCRLKERTPYGREQNLAGLLEPCCEPLARMLSGVSLPPRSAVDTAGSPELPAEALRAQQRLRDHLLVAARCSHVRVKQTKSGAPSRTQLRKFEGEISTDGEPLWRTLETAVALGLAGGSGRTEFLGPNLARLLEAADRSFIAPTTSPTLRAAASWAASGPVPVEYLVRHYHNAEQRRGQTSRSGRAFSRPATAQDISALVSSTLGMWCGTLDDQLVVALPTPAQAEADGHVLPNYDIILGPNTPLRAAAVLGCAAELVRLDRLASLRLTPESVRAAIALGLEVSEILEALDRVGTREAPQTVRRSVEEWAASTRLARIVRDRVIVLPVETAARLAEKAGGRPRFELLAPGVLRVPQALSEAKLAKTLEDAGVSVHATLAGADADAAVSSKQERGTTASTAPVPIPVPIPGEALDPDVRARVHEALARRDFPQLPAPTTEPTEPTEPAEPARSVPRPGPRGRVPPSVDALLRRMQEGHVPSVVLEREMFDAVAALEGWHGKLRIKARAKVHLPDLFKPQGLAALVALLAPDARARILNRCTNPGQIERRALTAIGQGHVSELATFGLGNEDEHEQVPPELYEFPSLLPQDVRLHLEAAADCQIPVWLLLNRGGKQQVSQRLLIETVEPRGRDLMVLARADDGSDPADSERFALPLVSISSLFLTEEVGQEVGQEDDLFPGMDMGEMGAMMAAAARHRRRTR